jgi:2-polyprenyl-3-methyl-5-hydroxy-6-metoxy-1,4-benzoquinol methylase
VLGDAGYLFCREAEGRTRRCSEREPADSLRGKSNVIGGWLPSLTFAFGNTSRASDNTAHDMTALRQLGHPATYPRVLSLLHLKHGSRVLDVGAGSGCFSRELVRAGYEVHATDSSVGQTQFETQEIRFTPCDLNRPGDLPFAPESFEAAVCVEVVEHLENHYDLVRKVHRILVPGGIFVVTTPNILNLSSRVRFLLSGHFAMFGFQYELCPGGRYYRPQAHVSPCSYWLLRHSLHTNGFRIRVVTTEKLRRSSLLLAPFIPIIWWRTRSESSADEVKFGAEQIIRNKEAARHVLSKACLFGKSLIIAAEKASG